jgi:hypothetical protein
MPAKEWNKELYDTYKNAKGVWLAFESNTSSKVKARASTAQELAKICGVTSEYIIRSQENTEKAKYKYCETPEEAAEYVRLGLNCSRAVLHIPTGNRWETPKAAAEWLRIPSQAIVSMTCPSKKMACKNFITQTGHPIIKDETLRMVRVIGKSRNKWIDIWESMPGDDWEKYKDAPKYDDWMEMQAEKRELQMSHLGCSPVRKQHLTIPIKIIDNSDYLATRKIGEAGTLISRYCGGMHPYKVLFEDSSVIYTRPDQIEFLNQTR